MTTPDLGHRDWLLFTQIKLIQSVDKDVSTQIVDTPNGGKNLIVSGISDATIEKLKFLTNSDQNNNYLYLESFSVFVYGFSEPINIPGLDEIAINLFQSSDVNNFLLNNKTHIPFTRDNVINNSGVNRIPGFDPTKITTFSYFIDLLTKIIPFSPNTDLKTKIYQIILNPDAPRSLKMNTRSSRKTKADKEA